MSLYKEILDNFIANFLEFTKDFEINTLSDIETMLNSKVGIENSSDFVEIQSSLSDFGTKACTLSYVHSDKGIVLGVKINGKLKYSKIFVKLNSYLDGYTAFGVDGFGNIQQEKKIFSSDFSKVKEELKKLLL